MSASILDPRMIDPSKPLQITSTVITNLTATNILTPVLSNLQTWDNVSTFVQANSASWEESAEVLPTVTNYLSTNNITLSSVTLNDSFIGATSATSINIGSLSARTFALIHDPANDGVDPIFDIGETLTGSFSGFRICYEEPTNRLIGSSRTGTTILTSFMINTATGQVGISGLPVAGQALTVIGNISATGTIYSSNIVSNTLTTSICAMSGNGSGLFVMNFTNGLLTSVTS